MAGLTFRDIVRPEDVAPLEDRLARRLRGEAAPGRYRLTIIRPDGTEMQLEMTAAATTWHGERVGLFIARDVTGREPDAARPCA